MTRLIAVGILVISLNNFSLWRFRNRILVALNIIIIIAIMPAAIHFGITRLSNTTSDQVNTIQESMMVQNINPVLGELMLIGILF